MNRKTKICSVCSTRREFLRTGFLGLGLAAGIPPFLSRTAAALTSEALAQGEEKHPNRILVVVELAGGNDGLNTVIPYNNDEYYKARPTLAIPREQILKVHDEYGFHPSMSGLESLYQKGHLAVVHGCGYPNPNRSHFTSMEYWHTGVPNGADSRGWIGRFADEYAPTARDHFIVGVAKQQSLALRSRVHAPVVFHEPDRFERIAGDGRQEVLAHLARSKPATGNDSLDFLNALTTTSALASEEVRTSCAEYQTKVDYGAYELAPDLRKVAALIDARLPTRIYYLSLGGFDTHASQAGQHSRRLDAFSDALTGFFLDLERIGRADDVAVLVFTEFGRRVKENASQGTDHGVATPMYLLGKNMQGGFYGEHPSLTDLDAGDLKMTMDFRRVYATVIQEWMGYDDTQTILKGDFPGLGVFA